MDPLSLSTAFASIVGLIGIFKQERKGEKDQGRDAFLQWLDEHRHQSLKDLILRSEEITSGIDRALQENCDVILAKLEKIDEVLAALASRVGGVAGIARSVHPHARLSEQAVDILRQLVNSNSKEFDKQFYRGGRATLSLVSGGTIQITEPRFLDDDLTTLVELDLLNRRYGSSGGEFYGITRNAVKLIEAIDMTQR